MRRAALILVLLLSGCTNKEDSNVAVTYSRMGMLIFPIMHFESMYNKFPDSIDDLISCPPNSRENCYTVVHNEEEITDAWGNRFIYEKMDRRKFKLISLGADGKEGGEGPNADIVKVGDF